MNANEALAIVSERSIPGLDGSRFERDRVEALAVLRGVVEERDALKAEVERLDKAIMKWKTRDFISSEAIEHQKARAERAEADLLAARPLLDVIEHSGCLGYETNGIPTIIGFDEPSEKAVLEAALAYRAAKGDAK